MNKSISHLVFEENDELRAEDEPTEPRRLKRKKVQKKRREIYNGMKNSCFLHLIFSVPV